MRKSIGQWLIFQAPQRIPCIIDFSPYGYDERQYCSPGFDLAVGLFQRSKFGAFPEYHTSADDLDLIRPDHLQTSYNIIAEVITVLESNCRYVSTCPKDAAREAGVPVRLGATRIARRPP